MTFGERIEQASALMLSFAERTGLSSNGEARRYLWTDAFAVCNFLGLHALTHDERHRELALLLVDHVHHTLGRHRDDDPRRGWLSGLSESEGERHPTLGGLRIGKKLPERRADEPFDRELEWERDGQYLHYLTQWMHALNQAACFTSQPHLNLWARELAQTALVRFRTGPTEHRRLAWKLSIDLSRPLVSSMGQHDALDGFVTCAELQSTAVSLSEQPAGPLLERELESLVPLLVPATWTTGDPLGLGGVLLDAWRSEELALHGVIADERFVRLLLAVALEGLEFYAGTEPQGAASQRLAFRELGLSIGLSALERLDATVRRKRGAHKELAQLLKELEPYAALGARLEDFWLEPRHRSAPLWEEHRDINEVMLATRLVPEGYLAARAPS